MKQKDAFDLLAAYAQRHDSLVVPDIGSQALWLKVAKDRPEHLYLSGPMGMSSSVALGVAFAQKERLVIAASGDGALGMNLSALCTISHARPRNLIVVVMNNGIYEFTKGLPSPTTSVAWPKVPEVFPGFQSARSLVDLDSLDKTAAMNGPHFVYADIEAGELPPPLGMTAPFIHERFLHALKK